MAEPHDLMTQEHGALASIAASLGALLMAIAQKITKTRAAPKETQEQREKRLEDMRRIADLEERLLQAQFKALEDKIMAVIGQEARRIDDIHRENGRQAEQIGDMKKDIDNYFRMMRGQPPKDKVL